MKRREFLKTTGFAILGLAGLSLGCASSSSTTQAAPAATATSTGSAASGGKKPLIVYFSRSGNTKAVAEEIQKLTGGDLVEIKTVTPYPDEYRATTEQAKAEQQQDARPAISTKIDNFDQYDTVYLGYPNWWGSMPMPIATFLDTYKMNGKRLALFMTHGGGGIQRCYSDLVKRAQGAQLASDYLCLSGSSARSSQDEIRDWVAKVR